MREDKVAKKIHVQEQAAASWVQMARDHARYYQTLRDAGIEPEVARQLTIETARGMFEIFKVQAGAAASPLAGLFGAMGRTNEEEEND